MNAIGSMLKRIDATLAQPGSGFPHFADTQTGVWTRTSTGDWTGGFWCGMLWLAAFHTGLEKYRSGARDWMARLQPRVASQSVFKGFLFWYGAALGSRLVGDDAARALAGQGAHGLQAMYDSRAGLIPLGTEAEEAANVGPCEANIDSLPGTTALLFTHGAQERARSHVRQHVALCVREDGSICQSATFDPRSGALVRRYTHKGIHDNSTWARAQAWGMLGVAQALAFGADEFRPVAMRLADWWIAHVPPDRVAYWDFDAPATPDRERDTSATAIAAASLLKLAALIPERRDRYRSEAQAMVDRLASTYLTPVSEFDTRPPGILTEGCFNRRLGVAARHELIWGDYFLLESLLALTGKLDARYV